MSVNARPIVFQRILTGVLGVLLLALLVYVVALYADHGSLAVRCGMLPKAQEMFLEGSGRVFQQASWHLGDGTRTWGDTYGIKIRRAYLSVQVTHINPRRTAKEAREEE